MDIKTLLNSENKNSTVENKTDAYEYKFYFENNKAKVKFTRLDTKESFVCPCNNNIRKGILESYYCNVENLPLTFDKKWLTIGLDACTEYKLFDFKNPPLEFDKHKQATKTKASKDTKTFIVYNDIQHETTNITLQKYFEFLNTSEQKLEFLKNIDKIQNDMQEFEILQSFEELKQKSGLNISFDAFKEFCKKQG